MDFENSIEEGEIDEEVSSSNNRGQYNRKTKKIEKEDLIETIKYQIVDDIIYEGNEFGTHGYLNCGILCKHHEVDDEGTHHCRCDDKAGLIDGNTMCKYREDSDILERINEYTTNEKEDENEVE